MANKEIKERLEKALKKIGWTLVHVGCDFYIPHDQKGRPSNWELFGDSIKYKSSYGEANVACSFDLSDLDSIKVLSSGKTVSCGSNQGFVIFMNHDKEE